MIQFIDISLRYGQNVLFDHFSWHIKAGSKIALVGPNGSGKTTLYRIAMERQKPDSGNLVISRNTIISLFDQIPHFPPNRSVIETALEQSNEYSEYTTKYKFIQTQMEQYSPESKEYGEWIHKQSELEEYAQHHGIHETETKIKKILGGLGFTNQQLKSPTSSLSPGYQHRLALAIALFNPHNLLLLDEPTNHLDVQAKEWLANWLKTAEASFVLVSHDPEFMDETTSMIGELTTHGVLEFTGSLDEYLEEKNEIHLRLKKQFEKEESFLNKRKEWIERFRSKASKAKQVQSLIKRLDKREKIDRPDDIYWNEDIEYSFKYTQGSRLLAKIENGLFRYPSGSNTIFQNVDLEISLGDKIALVGPNGAGKSTLLGILSGKYKLTEGKLNISPKTITGLFSQTHMEELDPELSLIQTVLNKYPDLAELEIRRILGFFSFSGDSVFKKVNTLSGGEQSRLRLSMLVHHPCNFLLLDEPTNHLDLVTRNSLKNALMKFPGSLLIISHDPDFLSGLCNRTLKLANHNLVDFNCNYEEYLNGVDGSPDTIKQSKDKKNNEDFQKIKADKNRQKKVKSAIEKIQEEIIHMENEKIKIENLMNTSSFYQEPNYLSTLDQYETLKSTINLKMAEWEKLENEISET